MRMALYIIAGLLIIAGVACFAIFYNSGSVEALGGAVMFICFGFAGFVIGNYATQISGALTTKDEPESSV